MGRKTSWAWGCVALGALFLPAKAAAEPSKEAPEEVDSSPEVEPGSPPPRRPAPPPRQARWDEPFAAAGGQVTAGLLWRRPWLGGESGRGIGLGGGQVVHLQGGPVRVGLIQGGTVRIFGARDIAAGYTYDVFSSLLLGPLAADAWVGLTSLSIDHLSGQWSAQLFSPRVGVGASIRAGSVMIGAHVFSEYGWRWFGPDDRLLGLVIDVRWLGHRFPLDWSEFTRGGS